MQVAVLFRLFFLDFCESNFSFRIERVQRWRTNTPIKKKLLNLVVAVVVIVCSERQCFL